MKKMFSFQKNSSVEAKDAPTSGATVSLTSKTMDSPISGAKVSPTSGTMATPTIQGSNYMEPRRPNFQNKHMSVIHKAAKEGNLWKMKQILFLGINDLNTPDKWNRTALHVACAYNHPRMVRFLMNRHCDMDFYDNEQKTPLIYALQYQNNECAHELINGRANLFLRDIDGNTAMHYAVLGHNTATVEKLLIFGADFTSRNKDDLTPLALAKLANNKKMVEFLISRGAKDDQLKRKQQLPSECKEERRPQTSQNNNLAIDLQESPKPAQNKTKSKTVVNKNSAEGFLNSKQQLVSECKEEKKPPKSENSNLATDLQESPKSAQTETKSKTVAEVSAEGSLNSKQQLNSEYEEGKTQTLESSLFVEDIPEKEDSLSSKEQLTSQYQERRRLLTSDSTHYVAIDLHHTRKQAWTETTSKSVTIALPHTRKQAWTETMSKTVVYEISTEDSLNSKQELTSEYEERKIQTLESCLFVEDIPEGEDSLSSQEQLTSEYQERKRPLTSESTHCVATDLHHTRKQAWTGTKSKTVDEISEKDSLSRLSRKSGIEVAWCISHNEDFKDKVISKTCILTAKTSENESKQIHHPPLHLENMSQESQINRACDKEDISAYSGHPSEQKDEEMCTKQGTLEQRKKLLLSKDESKHKAHEFSIKLKMIECPEEEPSCDNSEGGASLRQMPSNLTSKMLNCEGKDAFEMSVSAVLQTFPEREEPTLKIVPPSHSDPGSLEDSPSSSSSERPLRGKELHSENDHKPDAEHVLNKNEGSFYNDTENKKVRYPIVASEVREEEEFAMQVTKNINPNTTDWKLGIGPSPQSGDPKSHFDLWVFHCNETKPMIELKSHYMPAVTSTHMEIKPNQDLFQKPLCADHRSANYCKSLDSKLKDEHSYALHNDRTPGVYVNEEDFRSLKNDLDMVKVEKFSWKRKKFQLQKEVPESSDRGKSLLHENRMLWDENSKLRLEIDTLKNQAQEMGNKYFEDIAIVNEKNDCLQKTLRETVFQHNAQLKVLRTELIMLNSKLENEQQNRGRLEAEVESYRSRLATTVQDHEHCQTSKRDLQIASQRERDEWICSREKMKFDMSNLKHNNEILSQQLSKLESKNNNLEIELHRRRDAPKQRTLVLEREVSQKQCQKEETEHVCQEEQGKMDKDVGKQESLLERLSHLQRENTLLHQQLEQVHSKADREENTAINIQDQIQDAINIFKAESIKQFLSVKESINYLINEWHHFKARINQYENDNIERNNGELIAKLQPSSKCIHLEEEKTPSQELSVEALLKECEQLENTVEIWEEIVNLRTQMEMNMVKSCEVESITRRLNKEQDGSFHRTKERLAEVSTKLLLEEQLKIPLVSKTNSTPGGNLGIPTSRSCTSKYHRMWQDYGEALTRELKEGAAQFETESYRVCPIGSVGWINQVHVRIYF